MARRLKREVFHSSNVHQGFWESWLRPALTDRVSVAIFGPIGLFQARSAEMKDEEIADTITAWLKIPLA